MDWRGGKRRITYHTVNRVSSKGVLQNTRCRQSQPLLLRSYYEIISRPYVKTILNLINSRDSHIAVTDRDAGLAAKNYAKFY